MKKILTLSVAALVLSAPAALADHHMDGDKDGKHHKGKMFEKLDADGDGSISKVEFMQKHEQKFNEMDADNDGSISKDEAEAKMKEWREKMKEKRAEWKKHKDVEGSGDTE